MSDLNVTALGAALLATFSRASHAGLCPVWAKQAPIPECNCWMKARELKRAGDVMKALALSGPPATPEPPR